MEQLSQKLKTVFENIDSKFVRVNFCYNPGILQNIPGMNVTFLDAKSLEATQEKRNLPVSKEIFISNFFFCAEK